MSDAGSKCPSCGSTRRRYDRDSGASYCFGCGRDYEPFALGDEEQDPLLDARDFKVRCTCGRDFTMRSHAAPTQERIDHACGCRTTRRLRR